MEQKERPADQQEKPIDAPPMPAPVIEGNEQGLPQEPAPKPEPYGKWTCWATVVIAASTTIYMGFAGWQLRVMRGQLAQMQFASRAWVGVAEMTHDEIVPGQKIHCEAHFINTGSTPANVDEIKYALVLAPPNSDIKALATSTEAGEVTGAQSRGFVAPNTSMTVSVSSKSPLSESDVAAIKAWKTTVYVFGTISYFDIFGACRETEYCYTLDPRTNRLRAYKQHNNMK